MNAPQKCTGPLRRDALCVGGLSALGLGLLDWTHAEKLRAASTSNVTAKSCILIWLDGGPSHLETFDPKPEAPVEVRGPLESIATSIAGIRLSECLPNIAGRMDDVAIIRSMTSPLGEHNFGTHYLQTGYKPTPALEYPCFGSAFSSIQATRDSILPDHIAVPDFRVGGSKFSGHGYLSSEYRPFSLDSDPSRNDFEVKDLEFAKGLNLERLSQRKRFVEALDRFSREGDAVQFRNPDLERAYALVASEDAKTAFQLENESTDIRRKYGPKSIGQSCLLARRLIERQVPFVTVNNRGWDTHNDLQTRLKSGFAGAKVGVGLVPSLDLALSALIDDLKDRGLFDETLVVVMGEFGRTPKLNTNGGRDHWPRVFSVLLAGGGVQGGQVIGKSDAVGESPADRPITPADLAATIYAILGVNPSLELETSDGRPVRLTPPEASLVSELIA